jgi:regulator of sigma E protease
MLGLLVFILILSVLIIVHEFGHFLAAKKSGVAVEKFAIGFGPVLLRIKGKETEFLVCLFPLGGYVKMAGDSRADCRGREDEFLSKPPGIKMRIVFAGPLFNYILAFFIFWLSFSFFGFFSSRAVIGHLADGYPAQQVGIREGDEVLSVNGRKVRNWPEMAGAISESKEQVTLKIKRQGDNVLLTVPLKEEEFTAPDGEKRTVSRIGVSAKIEKYNFVKSFFKAGQSLLEVTVLIVDGFISIISGKIPVKKALAGPLGIYYFTSQAVQKGLVSVLNLTILLNISLTIVNLLPFPVFDGGHILFFLIERIRNKRLSEKAEEFFMRVGLVFIGVLIMFVLYNDIIKFGPKIWGGKKATVDGSIAE